MRKSNWLFNKDLPTCEKLEKAQLHEKFAYFKDQTSQQEHYMQLSFACERYNTSEQEYLHNISL